LPHSSSPVTHSTHNSHKAVTLAARRAAPRGLLLVMAAPARPRPHLPGRGRTCPAETAPVCNSGHTGSMVTSRHLIMIISPDECDLHPNIPDEGHIHQISTMRAYAMKSATVAKQAGCRGRASAVARVRSGAASSAPPSARCGARATAYGWTPQRSRSQKSPRRVPGRRRVQIGGGPDLRCRRSSPDRRRPRSQVPPQQSRSAAAQISGAAAAVQIHGGPDLRCRRSSPDRRRPRSQVRRRPIRWNSLLSWR
jgi:hypothetical protein